MRRAGIEYDQIERAPSSIQGGRAITGGAPTDRNAIKKSLEDRLSYTVKYRPGNSPYAAEKTFTKRDDTPTFTTYLVPKQRDSGLVFGVPCLLTPSGEDLKLCVDEVSESENVQVTGVKWPPLYEQDGDNNIILYIITAPLEEPLGMSVIIFSPYASNTRILSSYLPKEWRTEQCYGWQP